MRIQQFRWDVDQAWKSSSSIPDLNPQLVLLFADRSVAQKSTCLADARSRFPKAQVIGCSSGGEILGRRVTDNTAAMTALEFDHSKVASAMVHVSDNNRSFEAGRELIAQLDPNGLRHVLVFCDGLVVIGSDFLEGVNEALPQGVTVSGGFAADGNSFQETSVWCNSEARSSSIAAVGLYGERLRVGLSATGGWGPFGPDRLVTRSHKNVLFEVDGRPALALYKDYLGEYASQLPSIGLMFPLELRDPNSGNRVLRALIGIDEREQSISFAGNVPQGWFTRFMVGDIEDLIDGTLQAAQRSLLRHNPGPEFSLLVSCNARRAVLKQRVEEEVDAAHEALGGSKAVSGFYSYGEIAPSAEGHGCQLHNETMSITTLSEE